MNYTGTVTGSYDQTGLFGVTPGSSLDGLDYTLAFVFDTAAGNFVDAGYYELLYGSYGLASVGSATLTINGVSQTINGDNNQHNADYAENDSPFTFSYTRQSLQDTFEDRTTYISNQVLILVIRS